MAAGPVSGQDEKQKFEINFKDYNSHMQYNNSLITKTSRPYNIGVNILKKEEQRLLQLSKMPNKPLTQRQIPDQQVHYKNQIKNLASERSFGSLPSIPEVGPTDHILKRGLEARSSSHLLIAGKVITKSHYSRPIGSSQSNYNSIKNKS